MGVHQDNRRRFAILLFVIQVVVIVMYGIFVRPMVHSNDSQNAKYYPMYQDINVMMLIGFGCLMAFLKHHSWSALSYTFLINAVIVQLYLLWQPFWHKVFTGGWDQKILIVEKQFTKASYSVAAVLISLGAVLGRVGPFEFLLMGVIQIIGFTLNQSILYDVLGIFDNGGSTRIHVFGAYFGITVSLIIGAVAKPKRKPEQSYYSSVFAMIGTLYLWMFWPSFNAGYFPTTPYQRSITITNTIISLTGSCLGTFILTVILKDKISINDILNATLAGGVVSGATSGVFTNPAGSLCVGIFTGVITTICFNNLQGGLRQSIGLEDTCGVHNLHGIPGILGGVFSAIAIASYTTDPLSDQAQISYLSFYPKGTDGLNLYGRTFYTQGGIQIAAIFISMGIGIVFGIIAGVLIRAAYGFEPEQFYRDDIHFQTICQVQTQSKIQPNLQNSNIGMSKQPMKLQSNQSFYT